MALLPVFDVARSGLLAQELGLTVTGNNVANVNTPGYSRQRAEFASQRSAADLTGVLVGRGVRVETIRAVVDPLVDRRLRSALTNQDEQTARRDQLSALAGILNDVQEPGLSTAVDGFFDAAEELARNPAGLAERETLLGKANALAGELNRRAASLAGLQRNADDRLVTLGQEANGEISRIAELNRQIAVSEVGGQHANELRDQRENTLKSLASKIGINVLEHPDGTVQVSAPNGVTFVDRGSVIYPLTVQNTGNGLDGVPLHELGVADPAGGFISIPTTFTRGEVAAQLAVRDSDVPTAATNLNTFAASLASTVNAVQQGATARDLDGLSTVAVPFFSGTTAATLDVAITDARRIAAARSTDTGDASNALALADLRGTPQAALGGSTPSGYLAAEEARVGQAASSAADVAAAGELVAQQVQGLRDSVSGVNLNEELTNLLRYQRAFQANAQVINVADTVLGELVNLIR